METWLPGRTLICLWAGWLVAAAVIVWLANGTHIDITLADQAFDFHQQRFQLKHDFLFETVMHAYAKKILIGCWLILLFLAVLPTTIAAHLPAKLHGYTLSAYALRWIVGLALVNSSLVAWMKHLMPHACPWDITRYGGHIAWVPAFSWHAATEAGHCFPAGHATSGLWLSALCLLWLPHHPRKALAVALLGLAAGLLLGWSQQMRGAHFLSHTLSSVWLMCGLLLCVLSFTRSHPSCFHDF
ncbi:phosphatase PAP2 family protein [Methylophilus aquaticus]|uniref:PAP2 family protein n=1 Tax=Methylophilus aquaticus TaxID=1971610 RepID=A0ABT9JPE2_9PROT|nr:phosphatase PAP2 family protein [Methylophilus aquaticus]MDP8566452.1 PAP2 family protein [Methylophilus aquaticus]